MSADARGAAGLTAPALLALLILAGALLAPRLPDYVRQARGALPAAGDFSDDERARGRRLRRRTRPLTYARLLLNLVLAVLLGATGLGSWLVQAVARPFGGAWYWQAPLGAVVLLLLTWLVGLPLGVAAERVLRREGLSVQSWSSWAADRAKGLLLAGVFAGLLAEGGYALIRAAPNWWWIAAAVSAAAL